MQCKLLWIKASAKCIKVNVTVDQCSVKSPSVGFMNVTALSNEYNVMRVISVFSVICSSEYNGRCLSVWLSYSHAKHWYLYHFQALWSSDAHTRLHSCKCWSRSCGFCNAKESPSSGRRCVFGLLIQWMEPVGWWWSINETDWQLRDSYWDVFSVWITFE